MKVRRYKFIGQDGSLGLKKDALYTVGLKRSIFSERVLAYIYLTETKGITCPYSSMKTFNKNWEVW